jgi:hypothetical protein
MDKTTILYPLEDDVSNKNEKAKELTCLLHHTTYFKDASFNTFLVDIKMTRDEYIFLLRSCLLEPILLLKRNPCDIWINGFSKKVPTLLHANTDAQFILDAYAPAAYCNSYITKMDRTKTSAFKKIREEFLCKIDIKIKTIRKLGNTLLNMQQMSSHQAVHIVMSLPLYSSPRTTIFINTAPFEK